MDINLKGRMPGVPSLPPQLPSLLLALGCGSIGLGVLLIMNPELLTYLVAFVFILIGGLLLLTGWRAKRMLG
ncbi:MAG TPA: hypothetical protein ENI87_13455 [bacterium]|nr:hypothetical protein [bacterium]